MHGHTVRIGSRFELVAQPQFEIALMPEVRIIQLTDFFRALFDKHALFKVEQVRGLAGNFLPPAIKVASRNHIMANTLVVKLKQCFIINQDVATARFML